MTESMYDLNMRLIAAVDDLNQACEDLRAATRAEVDADHWYKKHHSRALLAVGGAAKNQGQREAIAYESLAPTQEGEAVTVGDLEYAHDMTKGMKEAQLEVVRAKRTVLSAIQTLANLSKEEAAFARTGPTG